MRFLDQILLYRLRQLLNNLLYLWISRSQFNFTRIFKIIIYFNLSFSSDTPLPHIILYNRVLIVVSFILFVDLLEDNSYFINVIGELTAAHQDSNNTKQDFIRTLWGDVSVPYCHCGHGTPIERLQVSDFRVSVFYASVNDPGGIFVVG